MARRVGAGVMEWAAGGRAAAAGAARGWGGGDDDMYACGCALSVACRPSPMVDERARAEKGMIFYMCESV